MTCVDWSICFLLQIGQLKKGLNPPSLSELDFGSPYLMTAVKTGVIIGVIALAVSDPLIPHYHITCSPFLAWLGSTLIQKPQPIPSSILPLHSAVSGPPLPLFKLPPPQSFKYTPCTHHSLTTCIYLDSNGKRIYKLNNMRHTLLTELHI